MRGSGHVLPGRDSRVVSGHDGEVMYLSASAAHTTQISDLKWTDVT